MKKEWREPKIDVQQFTPNEYVAACYNIECNVPTGFGFIDKNGNGKYDKGDNKLTKNGVYGCGTVHEGVPGVPGDGPTANAMWQPQKWQWAGGLFGGKYVDDGSAYDVFYWRDGKGANDIHFSKVSDAHWKPNPNAS